MWPTPAAPDLTGSPALRAAFCACTLIGSSLVYAFLATIFEAPSSHRRRKLVEIDVVGLDAVHLQNGQHGVDHRRRSAGIGVDRAASAFPRADGARRPRGRTRSRRSHSSPAVGVRQRGNEFEVLAASPRWRRVPSSIEQIGPRAGAIEEPNRPLLAALDVIGQDRPERRHARAAADQQHRPGALLAPKAGSVGSLGDERRRRHSIRRRAATRTRRSGYFLMMKRQMSCPRPAHSPSKTRG